jgi:hypothetical protein
LEIHHVPTFELRMNALQSASAPADGAQTGRLSERTGMNVHSPDFYGKLDRNTLLAPPIHGF